LTHALRYDGSRFVGGLRSGRVQGTGSRKVGSGSEGLQLSGQHPVPAVSGGQQQHFGTGHSRDHASFHGQGAGRRQEGGPAVPQGEQEDSENGSPEPDARADVSGS